MSNFLLVLHIENSVKYEKGTNSIELQSKMHRNSIIYLMFARKRTHGFTDVDRFYCK